MKSILGNLAVALLVVTGAACSSGSADAPVASTSRPSSSPTVAASPTAPTDPLEGTWETGPLSQQDIVSAYVAAGGSEREGKAFFAELEHVATPNGSTTTAVITIKFQVGAFAEFATDADGLMIQGDQATYELLGDGSLRKSGVDCVSTYTYQVQGDRLRMRSQKRCAGDLKTPYGTTLYASFPFTRVS